MTFFVVNLEIIDKFIIFISECLRKPCIFCNSFAKVTMLEVKNHFFLLGVWKLHLNYIWNNTASGLFLNRRDMSQAVYQVTLVDWDMFLTILLCWTSAHRVLIVLLFSVSHVVLNDLLISWIKKMLTSLTDDHQKYTVQLLFFLAELW